MAIVNGLTTVDNAKIVAGIPLASATYNAALELLINRVSSSILLYLGRKLKKGTYSEVLPGNSRQLLLLNEWPISSITSISLSSLPLEPDVDYRLDPQDKLMGAVYREQGWLTEGFYTGLAADIVSMKRAIEVTYIAGYLLPADVGYAEGGADSLPLSIQGVAEEMISSRLTKIKVQGNGLSSYSEGGISYGFRDDRGSSSLGISDEHALILNGYRRGVAA